MQNSHHEALNTEAQDTYLLSPIAENALSEIAHDRFEMKHQLVLHAFVAQRQRPFKEHEDNDIPEIERHLDIDAMGKLYMFLHQLDYDSDAAGTGEITDEIRHGRMNYLKKVNTSLQHSCVKLSEEKEALEEKLKGLHLES